MALNCANGDVNHLNSPSISSSANCNGHVTAKNKACVVLGAQWGDEGKGKIVDLVCQNADVVCRCQVSGREGYPVLLLTGRVIMRNAEFCHVVMVIGLFVPKNVRSQERIVLYDHLFVPWTIGFVPWTFRSVCHSFHGLFVSGYV